jgi:hypothetical protein
VPADGELLKSVALPGLWLLIPAFRTRSWHQVLGAIAEGAASWEHHEILACL